MPQNLHEGGKKLATQKTKGCHYLGRLPVMCLEGGGWEDQLCVCDRHRKCPLAQYWAQSRFVKGTGSNILYFVLLPPPPKHALHFIWKTGPEEGTQNHREKRTLHTHSPTQA